jgi:aryl-alcohol dehydrogenase-like predicted oxidoreductase
VVIATKFGIDMEETGTSGMDSRPEHIRAVARGGVVEAAEDRLHRSLLSAPRHPNVPMEEVAGMVKELIGEGKVKHFGPVRSRRAEYPQRPFRFSGGR